MPLTRDSSLEPAIQRLGREIFERAEAAAPPAYTMEYWQQAAMTWMSRDEGLKFRLFRFIEVLPSLRTDEAIARHLREYLRPVGEDAPALPGLLELAVGYEQDDSLRARLTASVTRFGTTIMARRFVCGSTPDEAIAAMRRLRASGMTFTLDVLGETVIADRVAQGHQQTYLDLIGALGRAAPTWPRQPVLDEAPWGPIPRVNISIKLSAIVSRFDPVDSARTSEAVAERLRPVLRAARDRGAFINVDMEHYAVKDLTLAIYKQILSEPEFRDWPDCGIVVQAYLADGHRDMAELVDWARRRGVPLTVRLVKGAYWDYETMQSILTGRPIPVFMRKSQSDASFERIARLMLENADIVRPAFASHNVRSIAAALAMEHAMGVPPGTAEFQMLTGMGEPLKRAVVAMGRRLRVYAPFGELMPGMAYLIRRLIENTSNESFLRQGFSDRAPLETLLRNPAGVNGEDLAESNGRSRASGPPASGNNAVAAYLPVIVDPEPDECADMSDFTNEPDMDLSRAESRAAMEAALAEVRAAFGRTYPARIGGRAVENGRWFDSVNPANRSQVVGQTTMCGTAEVDRAVESAQKSASAWAATSPGDRADVLDRAADALHEGQFTAAAWQIYEVGKTWAEAMGDVIETIDYLRFYAREIRRLTNRPRRRDYPGESNKYVYMPRGIVSVISPFCFPTALLAGMTAAALAAGNSVIIKPARAASVCAARFVDLLNDCGLPTGVLNFIPGAGTEAGAALANHAGVDMIAFTGSTSVGKQIMASARAPSGEHPAFKHVVADLGGKNSIIIDDDADLDEAVQAVIASAFGYSGQKCTSCSRVIVLDAVHDDFVAKLVEATRGIRPGPPDRPGTSVGPLIDEEAVTRVVRYIEEGRRTARCVLEPEQLRRKSAAGADADALNGYFIGPVIFTHVGSQSPLAQDEIFGPVLAVLRASTFEHAIDLANGTPYALAGGIYSRSPSRIDMAIKGLRVGILYVNRRITASRVDRQPFGGIGMSGMGTKTGGPDYLRDFMFPRTISENTMRHGFAPVGGSTERASSNESSAAAAHATH